MAEQRDMSDVSRRRAATPIRRVAVAVALIGLVTGVAVVVWLAGDNQEPVSAQKPGLVAAPLENATITECIPNGRGICA